MVGVWDWITGSWGVWDWINEIVWYINGSLQDDLGYLDNEIKVLRNLVDSNNSTINSRVTNVQAGLSSRIAATNTSLNETLSTVQSGLQQQITNNAIAVVTNLNSILALTSSFSSEVTRIDNNINLNINRVDNNISELQLIFYKIGEGLGVNELNEIGDALGGIKNEILSTIQDEKVRLIGDLQFFINDNLHPVTDFINELRLTSGVSPSLRGIKTINFLQGLKGLNLPTKKRRPFIVPTKQATIIPLPKYIRTFIS